MYKRERRREGERERERGERERERESPSTSSLVSASVSAAPFESEELSSSLVPPFLGLPGPFSFRGLFVVFDA